MVFGKKKKSKDGKAKGGPPTSAQSIERKSAQGETIYMTYEEVLARTDFTDSRVYVAMYDYTPPEDQKGNQLAFVKGDQFLVLQNLQNNHWYVAENMNSKETGHVPSNRLGRPRG
eukprot:Pgem_evm1s7782